MRSMTTRSVWKRLAMIGLLALGGELCLAQQQPAPPDLEKIRRELEEQKAKVAEQMSAIQRQLEAIEAQKAKLAEQMTRLDELQTQLQDIEFTQPQPEVAATKTVPPPKPEEAEEIAAVPREAQRIDDLRDNPVDYTGQQLVDLEFPNSWPIPGTKTRLKFGGYFKLDYIQDFTGLQDRFQGTISSVPVPGVTENPSGPYMNMFAHESRFNFDLRSTTEGGQPLRLFLEMDFWNTGDNPFFTSPRLRHAYGVYGNILAGRTWGTLTDLLAVPVLIDFAGADAISGARRAQIRWEQTGPAQTKWAVAVEMLESNPEIGNPFDLQGNMANLSPVFVARMTRSLGDRGRMMFGGQVYQLRWDNRGSGPDPGTVGWGLAFSGRKYVSDLDYFSWQVSGGDGWGSNIATLYNAGSAAVLVAEDKVHPLFSGQGVVAYGHYFNPRLVTNISMVWMGLERSSFRAGDSLRHGGTAHGNLIWSPVKNVQLGGEYIWLLRSNRDGQFGTAHRIQFMVKYLF